MVVLSKVILLAVAEAVNVLVAVAVGEAVNVLVPVVVMVVVPMVLRGYEIEVKWMALFRDLIFWIFFAKFLETFILFLANWLKGISEFLEFMLPTRFKFKYERSSSLG